MKVLVCIRQSVSGEINPFDACALEAALQIEDADVEILSMGPGKSVDFLKGLTRLGAKKAILLSDTKFAGADTLATAYTLSLAVKKLAPHLILCGRQTIDGDTGQVGPELSVLTGYKLIANAMSINAKSSSVTVKNRNGEVITSEYPALLTVEKINNLRLPSIRSKIGEVLVWSAEDLKADSERCGLNGSPTKVLKTFENQKDRRKCTFINENELEKIIAEALNKQRVEIPKTDVKNKLKNVWIIGDAPRQMAETISDDIKAVPIDEPNNLAKLIEKEKPNVVLWASDFISKSVAPQVAAILKLGLCADCTALETDGNDLFMYRPAFSGNIIAKIRSTTMPVMATVRTAEKENTPIIVGVGMGAKANLDKVKNFAEKLGADIVSSRLMVDHDYFPYEKQVGLTGKSVSPKVYIAMGISGAVHHIAGVRSSDTIIAINSDRQAEIFEYSDFGIVADIGDVLK